MNERIKQLEIDANLYADEFWERKTPQWHQFYTEKFAELIVRECASLAYDGPGGILDHFGLEEHFGVEE